MKNIGYKDLAYEYDAFYRNKDYSRETAFISAFLNNAKCKTVLDVGCGTGSHMALIENQGLQVTGLDLNAEMLEIAAKKVKGKLYQADMSDFALKETYDAIICMFAAFNHNLTLDAAQKTLLCFRKHLQTDGLLLIDLYNAKASGSKVDQGAESIRKMEWNYNPQTNLTETSISYTTAEGNILADPFTMRLFAIDEMRSLLQNANFIDIEFWDNFTDLPGTSNSKNLVVSAKCKFNGI